MNWNLRAWSRISTGSGAARSSEKPRDRIADSKPSGVSQSSRGVYSSIQENGDAKKTAPFAFVTLGSASRNDNGSGNRQSKFAARTASKDPRSSGSAHASARRNDSFDAISGAAAFATHDEPGFDASPLREYARSPFVSASAASTNPFAKSTPTTSANFDDAASAVAAPPTAHPTSKPRSRSPRTASSRILAQRPGKCNASRTSNDARFAAGPSASASEPPKCRSKYAASCAADSYLCAPSSAASARTYVGGTQPSAHGLAASCDVNSGSPSPSTTRNPIKLWKCDRKWKRLNADASLPVDAKLPPRINECWPSMQGAEKSSYKWWTLKPGSAANQSSQYSHALPATAANGRTPSSAVAGEPQAKLRFRPASRIAALSFETTSSAASSSLAVSNDAAAPGAPAVAVRINWYSASVGRRNCFPVSPPSHDAYALASWRLTSAGRSGGSGVSENGSRSAYSWTPWGPVRSQKCGHFVLRNDRHAQPSSVQWSGFA
mmetsp:Transcript_2310/g.6832  ORF Transcript_2310/g.6832 Transcript_2310/m.6832 type:complete len:493 (-) Transcript_2310:1134-2612(-)